MSELPEKTDAMSALAAALVAGGWQKPTVESLMHMAHRLAGSSGLYRFDGLAQAAGILEQPHLPLAHCAHAGSSGLSVDTARKGAADS